MFDWPWLIKNTVIQTIVDITTGTATILAGGTSVTLSSTIAVSTANTYKIKFVGATDDWYLITAHTAGTGTLTISPAFVGSTNYTAGTYIIRKIYYSLASDFDRMVDMHQAINKYALQSIDLRNFDRIVPDPAATGVPKYFMISGEDATNIPRLTFYPIPDAKINVEYNYYASIVELSGDTDVPIFPSKWHPVLVWMALAGFGHMYIDDSRVTLAKARAEEGIKEMIKNYSNDPSKITVLQPWDVRGRYRVFGAKFPANFPEQYSGY
jgi:hypothetical protein